MTRGLILHTMPDDVRAILVALKEAADIADKRRGCTALVALVDYSLAASAREILSREHKG